MPDLDAAQMAELRRVVRHETRGTLTAISDRQVALRCLELACVERDKTAADYIETAAAFLAFVRSSDAS